MKADERINRLKEHAGDISWAALARKIGMRTQQRFYDIRNGKHSITADLAKKIALAFPEISVKWLMYGEGEMLVDVEEIPSVVVPVADISKSVGTLDEVGKISVGSLFPGAEYAITGFDGGMSEFTEGSYVIAKRVANIEMLVPSRDYVFLTEDFCLLRRFQQEVGEEKIMLYPTNQETYADGMRVYAPMTIPRNKLKGVYAVLGLIRTII